MYVKICARSGNHAWFIFFVAKKKYAWFPVQPRLSSQIPLTSVAWYYVEWSTLRIILLYSNNTYFYDNCGHVTKCLWMVLSCAISGQEQKENPVSVENACVATGKDILSNITCRPLFRTVAIRQAQVYQPNLLFAAFWQVNNIYMNQYISKHYFFY